MDEQLKRDTDEQLAGLEQIRAAAKSFPPDQQQAMLAKLKEAEAMLTNPETLKIRRDALLAERGQDASGAAQLTKEVEEQTPANPQTLFARRLREFLRSQRT